jgi:mannose-6-phosphate isomerase-like protein (cupin superfamily)
MNTHEVALTKGEGRSIWLLGDLYTFKFSGEALSVTELTAFPQNGPPPHIHLREDESFWVLDGEFSVSLGERRLTAGQSAFVHIPKGTLHTYKNIGSTPGRMIILLTPGGFERLWEELGEPATQLTTTSGRCRRDRETDRSGAQLSPPDSSAAAMKQTPDLVSLCT